MRSPVMSTASKVVITMATVGLLLLSSTSSTLYQYGVEGAVWSDYPTSTGMTYTSSLQSENSGSGSNERERETTGIATGTGTVTGRATAEDVPETTTTSTSVSVNDNDNVPLSDPINIDPNVSMQYRLVNTNAAADSTSTSTEPLSPNAIEFKMSYQGSGWLALGVNPAGRAMPGSEVILGKPLEANSASSGNINPAKYTISGYSSATVRAMDDAQQTLVNATITQQDGVTILQFTKLLNEPGEHLIDSTAANNFVFAVGTSSSYPSIHQLSGRQLFALDLSATESQPLVGEPVSASKGATIFIAHGIMAVMAWAFLAPLAVAASTLRDLFPSNSGSMWFKTHMTLNISATLLTLVAFLVAVIYRGARFNDKHYVTGWVICFAVLAQASLGAVRPPINPDAKNGLKGWLEQIQSKQRKRAYWQASHKTLGWGLLIVSMWQMYTGLQLLSGRYNTPNYAVLYWAWMICVWAVVAVAALMVQFRATKKQSQGTQQEATKHEPEA